MDGFPSGTIVWLAGCFVSRYATHGMAEGRGEDGGRAVHAPLCHVLPSCTGCVKAWNQAMSQMNKRLEA